MSDDPLQAALLKLFETVKESSFNEESVEQAYTEFVYNHRKDPTKTMEDCKCVARVNQDTAVIHMIVPSWFMVQLLP